MIENLESILVRFDNLNNAGRYQEVLADVEPLLSQQENTELYLVKANAQYGIGDLDGALKSLEKAIAANPDHVGARSNYGSVLFAMGRYVDGLNACDSALYIGGGFAPAYVNAAHCLAALGYIDLATEYLQQAVEQNPEDVSIMQTAALMMAEMDLYDLARDMFMQAARTRGGPDSIHEQIADFFATARRKGIDRTKVISDVNAWRDEFAKKPDVFRLSADLLG